MGKKSKKGQNKQNHQHHDAHGAGKGTHKHHKHHAGPVYEMYHRKKHHHNNDKSDDNALPTKVFLTILQGADLAPKDRDFLGRHTTSDPYVEIWSSRGFKVASTEPKFKTLDPVWDESFTLDFPSQSPSEQGDEQSLADEYVLLKIWDQDVLSDPDAMGTIKVPLDLSKPSNVTEWLDVPPDSARNAKGRLQVKVTIAPPNTNSTVMKEEEEATTTTITTTETEEEVYEDATEDQSRGIVIGEDVAPQEDEEPEPREGDDAEPQPEPQEEEAATATDEEEPQKEEDEDVAKVVAVPPSVESSQPPEQEISFLELGLSGEKVANVDSIFGHQLVDGKSQVLHRIEHGLGASDVFVEILNARDKLVARSEVWLNHLNPRFALLYIPLTRIQVAATSVSKSIRNSLPPSSGSVAPSSNNTNTDEEHHNIFINFYDWEESGTHKFIGHLTTTLEELVSHGTQQSTFPLEVNVHKKYGRVRVRCARIMNDVESRATPIDWRFVEHKNTVDWDLDDMDEEEKAREDAAEVARLEAVAVVEEAKRQEEYAEEKKVDDESFMAVEEQRSRRLKEEEDARLAAEAAALLRREEKAKQEAERLAKEEAERKAKEEAERKAKEEAERLAKEEAERKAKEEADRLAREEAERLEAERLAKEEAQRQTRLAAEAEAEALRLKHEEETRLAEEMEARRLKEEQEALLAAEAKAEALRLKQEEEARLAQEIEAQRLKEEEEARVAAEAEAQRLKEEEEARLAAELEAQRLKEEEDARLAAEAEAQRLKAEADARMSAEERVRKQEKNRLLEEAARKKAAEDSRLRAARRAAVAEAKFKREKEEAEKRKRPSPLKRRPAPLRNMSDSGLNKHERKSPAKSTKSAGATSGTPVWERLYTHDTACLRSGRIKEQYWIESPRGHGVHAHRSSKSP